MLLRSAIRVDKILARKKSFVAFCIHDSVVLDMSSEDKDLLEKMISAFSNTEFGNMKTSVSIGKNFGDMRQIL